jgi:hypothetical protein
LKRSPPAEPAQPSVALIEVTVTEGVTMNALKLLCAIALLAVAACQVSSPVELPQDQGLQPADGTCNPDVMPC